MRIKERFKLSRHGLLDTLALLGLAGVCVSVGLFQWKLVPGVLGGVLFLAALLGHFYGGR